jgi:hypothetical protein
MQLHQLISSISLGCVLIILGLVPGLMHWLVDGARQLHDSLFSPFPIPTRHDVDYTKFPRQVGLAGAGAALILVAILAYLSKH